jgi:hypothetical protein
MSIPSPYEVVFPGYFSDASCRLDRDHARSCIKELQELRELQQMPDTEKKRALLDAVDEDMAKFAHDPSKTEAMIRAKQASMAKAECRLNLQDAFDAYKAACEEEKDAYDAVE